MVRFPARVLALSSLLSFAAAAFAQSTSNGAGSAGCLGGSIAYLIGLIVSIGLTYFVYTDAKKRGMNNAVLWAVLTFFTGLIGLIIYLIVRKK